MIPTIGFANTPTHLGTTPGIGRKTLILKRHVMLQDDMSCGEKRAYLLTNIPPQDCIYPGKDSIALILKRHVMLQDDFSWSEEGACWIINIPPYEGIYPGKNWVKVNLKRHVILQRGICLDEEGACTSSFRTSFHQISWIFIQIEASRDASGG